MKDLTKTRIERLKDGESFIDIYKEEVKEIMENETCNIFFNTEKQYFYTTNYMEQIKMARDEKKLLTLPRKFGEFEFNVSKIFSYNELFRDSTCRLHNENYQLYKKEIKELFIKNNKSGLLEELLSNKYLMFQIEFEVNHTSRDLDNVMKPFLDNLFENVKNTDNSIKKLTDCFIFKNEDSNCESIYLRIIVLNEEDISLASIKNSIKYKKNID